MCVVSAVLDHGMTSIPQLDPNWWTKIPTQLPYPPVSPHIPTPFFPQPQHPIEPVEIDLDREAIVKEFLKLVKQAAILDEAAKQKDCEDPEKVKFLEKLLGRLNTMDQELQELTKEVRSLLKLDAS